MDEKIVSSNHRIMMNNREDMSITGVLDVLSFDEEMIVVDTDMGMLTIKGMELHIHKLNLEEGKLELDGDIEGITYSERDMYGKPGGSLLGRLFR